MPREGAVQREPDLQPTKCGTTALNGQRGAFLQLEVEERL
jgi:hypothetical protein